MFSIIQSLLEPLWVSSPHLLWQHVTGRTVQKNGGSWEDLAHYSRQYSGAPTDVAAAKTLGEVEHGPNGRKPGSGSVRRRLTGSRTPREYIPCLD